MADEVLSERIGRVEVITINRPEARNAINLAVARGIEAALDAAEADPECRAIVLAGAGDKAFSAGMDLKAFAAGEIPGTERGGFAGITKRDVAKPLVCAANGSALAGGCEVMLSCDLVVAAEGARFGIPEVSRGLIAGAGGLIRLPSRIPYAVALEMALTAEPIEAERAYALGLVNRVVPADRVVPEALALAERIAKNAPVAVRTSKALIREALSLDEDAAWALNDDRFAEISRGPDALEGAVAFAEKREPNWTGS
jgi:enoyl-CoA hydratase/carnithine racemase